MKRILSILATAVMLFTGFGSFAYASDGTITTQTQAAAQLSPVLSSISAVLGTIQTTYSSDQATLSHIGTQLGSFVVSLQNVNTSPSTSNEASTSEKTISDISTNIGTFSQEIASITARQSIEANLLSSLSVSLPQILRAYLSLPNQ